jgi:predicted RNase H-like nuclease
MTSRLLVGFDSAWTARNTGGLVGVLFQNDGRYESLGPPIQVNFSDAEAIIRGWQARCQPHNTLVLIDQPLVVKNESGQREVESIVGSLVSLRYGGMQPANKGRIGMFDDDAPLWKFTKSFGNLLGIANFGRSCCLIETYPVLALIALELVRADRRHKGRLPKYNPARRKTFRQEDWDFLCASLAGFFDKPGVRDVSDWLCNQSGKKPKKKDQDGLDACICLLVAMHLAEGKTCLQIGKSESGEIVVPYLETLETELQERCTRIKIAPKEWIRPFRSPS